MLKVGDILPQTVLKILTEKGIENVDLNERLKGKKVILFGVPGAFTPTCTLEHLASFLPHSDLFKSKGVDEVICIAVNDLFVLKAWGDVYKANDKITFLSDWDGAFSKAVGLFFEEHDWTLGLRSLRYNSIITDGVVKYIEVEENPGLCLMTKADEILKHL